MTQELKDEDKNNFGERCVSLEMKVKKIFYHEDSARVWVAVLSHIIIDIIKEEQNSSESLEQLIKYLYKLYE